MAPFKPHIDGARTDIPATAVEGKRPPAQHSDPQAEAAAKDCACSNDSAAKSLARRVAELYPVDEHLPADMCRLLEKIARGAGR
jgi:hypothetical protein